MIIDQLNKIENEYPLFFAKSGKGIKDYITQEHISSGVFINNDMPVEIITKIRNAFDAINDSNKS